MATRVAFALLVASAAVLAGCSGGLTDGTQSPRPTATPAPVPTVSSFPNPRVEEVPGLSSDGIEDPFRLGSAHRAILSNQSHTRWRTVTERFADGTLRRRTTAVTRVVPGQDQHRYLRERTFEGPVPPTGTIYPNATQIEAYGADRAYVRATYPNGSTTVASFRRNDGNDRTLAVVLAAFETRIAGRTSCGSRTCYVVRSTALETPQYLAGAFVAFEDWAVTGGSLVAFIDGRGLVHEYRVRYTVETPIRRYWAVRHVRYAALGETTIERPEWAETQG